MMATMLALRKDTQGPTLVRVPVPELHSADDVRIRVTVAGICRTDVLVAEGRMPSREQVILGHEFAGVVESAGPQAMHVTAGQRVVVNPIFGCGTCSICMAVNGSDAINCPYRTMLGVDYDGAFAEYVVVPVRNVFPVGTRLNDVLGAYVEPIAAALGVLNGSGLQPAQRGVIVGRNRFAVLVERILQQAGFKQVTLYDPHTDAPFPCDSFDFAIETQLTTTTLAEMIRLVQPRGTVILKSRTPDAVAVSLYPAIVKQLRFHAVNYGSFDKAIRLLTFDQLSLDGLLGPVYALSDFAYAFAEAQQHEAAKIFLQPG